MNKVWEWLPRLLEVAVIVAGAVIMVFVVRAKIFEGVPPPPTGGGTNAMEEVGGNEMAHQFNELSEVSGRVEKELKTVQTLRGKIDIETYTAKDSWEREIIEEY